MEQNSVPIFSIAGIVLAGFAVIVVCGAVAGKFLAQYPEPRVVAVAPAAAKSAPAAPAAAAPAPVAPAAPAAKK